MYALNANRRMLVLLGLSALLTLAVIGLRIGEGASGALEHSGVGHGTRIVAAPLKAARRSPARESIRAQHVLEVAVTTVAGAPVPGAQVVIRAGDEWAKVVATCATGPLGRAMFVVSDWQEYLVAALHAEFGAAEAVALPGVVDLRLCGKCELTARVFDQESRAAVAGVDIKITGPNGIDRGESTDGGGALGFVGLVPGVYRAEVNAQGFVNYQLPDIVVGAGTTHIDIPLFLGHVVRGLALDGDSPHPIAAGQVEAFLYGKRVSVAQLGGGGRFRLEGLPDIPDKYRVVAVGYSPAPERPTAAPLFDTAQGMQTRDVELRVHRVAQMVGVVRAAGVPVSGASVGLGKHGNLGPLLPLVTRLRRSVAAETSADGEFALNVPWAALGDGSGDYTASLLISAPGFAPQAQFVSWSGPRHHVDIELSPGATLQVRAMNEKGGREAGARIELIWERDGGSGIPDRGHILGYRMTNQEGGAVIPHVPAGRWMTSIVSSDEERSRLSGPV